MKKRPLDELWQTFRATVLMGTDEEGYAVARRIFFAGAEAAVSLVDAGDLPPTVIAELEEFEKQCDAEDIKHGAH